MLLELLCSVSLALQEEVTSYIWLLKNESSFQFKYIILFYCEVTTMENPGETPEDSSQRTTRGIQPLKDYPERQQQKTTPEDNLREQIRRTTQRTAPEDITREQLQRTITEDNSEMNTRRTPEDNPKGYQWRQPRGENLRNNPGYSPREQPQKDNPQKDHPWGQPQRTIQRRKPKEKSWVGIAPEDNPEDNRRGQF